MKKIKLTQNQYALIDNEDFELISKYKWHFRKDRRQGYAIAQDIFYKDKKKRKRIRMHNLIMGVDNLGIVDHINGNKLDNRKSNLRFATFQQQATNRPMLKHNTSGYKGVIKGSKNRWRAIISINNKKIALGSFKTKKSASIIYNRAARILFGEFANIKKSNPTP